jgi:hypothetical protein
VIVCSKEWNRSSSEGLNFIGAKGIGLDEGSPTQKSVGKKK